MGKLTNSDDWDSHWDRFSDSTQGNPAQKYRHWLITKILVDRVPTQKFNFLDIGSGQGDLMLKITQVFPSAILTGFELSETGVRISKEKVPYATFIQSDLFCPNEQLKKYHQWAHVVICSEVLEHVDDPVAFLQAIRSYLSFEARLVLTVPGSPMSAFDRHIGHRQHFTKKKIKGILGQAGFQVENVYLAGFPFHNLYRLIVMTRGERLADDVDSNYKGLSKVLANFIMMVFGILFNFNFRNSRWGWQIVAIAKKLQHNMVK